MPSLICYGWPNPSVAYQGRHIINWTSHLFCLYSALRVTRTPLRITETAQPKQGFTLPGSTTSDDPSLWHRGKCLRRLESPPRGFSDNYFGGVEFVAVAHWRISSTPRYPWTSTTLFGTRLACISGGSSPGAMITPYSSPRHSPRQTGEGQEAGLTGISYRIN